MLLSCNKTFLKLEQLLNFFYVYDSVVFVPLENLVKRSHKKLINSDNSIFFFLLCFHYFRTFHERKGKITKYE